jgi:hypothetical protein
VDQWGLFDRQFGRTDTQEPDPEGRIPIWEKATVQEMKDKFSAVGLGPRQVLPIFYHYILLILVNRGSHKIVVCQYYCTTIVAI